MRHEVPTHLLRLGRKPSYDAQPLGHALADIAEALVHVCGDVRERHGRVSHWCRRNKNDEWIGWGQYYLATNEMVESNPSQIYPDLPSVEYPQALDGAI